VHAGFYFSFAFVLTKLQPAVAECSRTCIAGYRDGLHAGCESAPNLDPTPIVHQIVEAEAELLISGVFDRRPTVTPSFSRKSFDCQAL
jgi:hypothetical protein